MCKNNVLFIITYYNLIFLAIIKKDVTNNIFKKIILFTLFSNLIIKNMQENVGW